MITKYKNTPARINDIIEIIKAIIFLTLSSDLNEAIKVTINKIICPIKPGSKNTSNPNTVQNRPIMPAMKLISPVSRVPTHKYLKAQINPIKIPIQIVCIIE